MLIKSKSFLFFCVLLQLIFFKALQAEPPVFVILTHIRDSQDQAMFKYSYQSVRIHHPQSRIIVIDDNSLFPIEGDEMEIIKSEFPGAGEILPYYYFLKYKWANKMIFLHDSMFLKRAFTKRELADRVKFHWHFSHLHDCDNFTIPMLKLLPRSEELMDFYLNHKKNWLGCFGAASYISLDVLEDIENKYSFISTFTQAFGCRTDRYSLERIYALILFKEGYLKVKNCSNFGDIHKFSQSCNINFESPQLPSIVNSSPGAIIKTWRGR